MVLDKELFALCVYPLEGVGAIAVHVAVAIGGASVRHKDSHLVESLGGVGPKVPSHVGVLDTSLRVTLLAMNEVGELDGVLDEEHRGVVANHVVVALLGVVLDSEATGVAVAVVGTALAGDGREAKEDRSSLADCVHEGGLTEGRDVVGDFDVSVGTSALRVDDSLGDSLAGEVSELVEEVEVLGEDGAAGTSRHRVLVVVDGGAGARSDDLLLHFG
mmetsp:Transcript_39289/g.51410  ORF Transcript_39289/g.51410 Transcript_39289/m.51410 type:complete len:217 (-) Transcript_39289:43-693(-)